MKFIFRFFVFFVISLSIAASFLNREKDEVFLFQKGEELYRKGDVEKAITCFERALNLDKNNKKIKTFLARVLKEVGNKYLAEGSNLKALVNFKKASDLKPQDEDLKHLCWSIEDEITLPRFAVYFQIAFDKVVENFSKNLQKFMFVNGIGFFAILSIGGLFFYRLILRNNRKRERVLIGEWRKIQGALQSKEEFYKKQQEQTLKMMQEENMLVSEASTKLATKQSFTIKEMIGDCNPYIRARGVEVLGEELVNEKDCTVVERLLVPFLEDKNNRVRANAVKALYSHNKELAMRTLRKMVQDRDSWMRLSAAWVLGEIGGPEATKILLTLIEDPDYKVQKRVLKSLVVARTKKEQPSEPIKGKDKPERKKEQDEKQKL